MMGLSRNHQRREGPWHCIAIHAAAFARGEAGAARRPQGRDSRRGLLRSEKARQLPSCGCPDFVKKGARRGRLPKVGMQGLRAHVLGEERLPARELEARPLRVDGVRGVHGRRAAPCARKRRPLRRVALHLVVHAHASASDAPPAPARTGGHVPRRWHPGQGQSVGEPQELEARARARAPPQRAGRPPGARGARQGADRRGMRRQRVRRLLLRCHRPRLGGCGRPRLGPCREDT